MTKEQFQILHKHYDILYGVAKTMTLIAPDFNAIEELYGVYEKLGYRPSNMRCNECRIGMILTLYRLHEENKNNFEDKPIKDDAKSEKHNTRPRSNAKNNKGNKG